jgi:peptidoglycan/LPS O-acetylase OafA/YrhL
MPAFTTVWRLMDVVPALGGSSPAAMVLRAAVPALPFAAAWLLWRYVEEPARRWMRRIGPRPAAVPEPVAVGEPAGGARVPLPRLPSDTPRSERSQR